MRTIKKDQHFTAEVEFTEAEIQCLVGVFQELLMYKNMSEDSFFAHRKTIYQGLNDLLAKK